MVSIGRDQIFNFLDSRGTTISMGTHINNVNLRPFVKWTGQCYLMLQRQWKE